MNEVRDRLFSLQAKNNITADGITSKLRKCCSESLSLPLTLIYNASMESGIVPELFKDTYVVPVHKKDPPLVSNFRQVSVTSVACRTMEILVRGRLIDRLELSGLLPENQFGLRANHSVSDALIGCMDDWTAALEQGHQVDCVYTDFSNAFDKLLHARLLLNLRGFGIESYLLDWIHQFLIN